jgi:hypothetical protein
MRACLKRLSPIAALLCAALALSAMAGVSEGQGKIEPIDPNGEPKGFRAGNTARYAIWHNKNGWHVRTTTAKRERHFKGIIRIEGGTFEKIHSHDLETEGRLRDWWKVGPQRQRVIFEFKTDRGIDGIDFRVSPSATLIHFNLHIDGKYEPELIFIGHHNHHPRSDPFNLPAHP